VVLSALTTGAHPQVQKPSDPGEDEHAWDGDGVTDSVGVTLGLTLKVGVGVMLMVGVEERVMDVEEVVVGVALLVGEELGGR
jgi:hypothetical protein